MGLPKGFKHSKETKEKIRLSRIGRKASKESRQRMVIAQQKRRLNYIVSEETKRRMSEGRKGKCVGNLNPMRRPEVVAKASERVFTEESRKKISLANSGRVRTHDNKRRISLSMKKYYHEHPEKGEKISVIIKNRNKIHPEMLQKFIRAGINARKNNINKRTKIELELESIVKDLGFVYKIQEPIEDVCIPDIIITQYKIALFADGCYWHGCPLHFPYIKKINDVSVTKKLVERGWHVIRIWEHDLINKEYATNLLASFLALKPSKILTLIDGYL